MPELPEVETVRLGLSRLVIGKAVKKVSFDWPKGFPNSQGDVDAFVIGATITDVRRRAKVLLIDLSTKYTLVIHLKMTGQLVFRTSGSKTSSDEQSLGAEPSSGLSRTNSTVKGATENTSQKSAVNQSEQPIWSGELTGGEESWGAGHPNESLIGVLPDKSTRVVFDFEDRSQLFFNDQRKFGWVKLLPSSEVQNMTFMQKVGPEPLEDAFTYAVFEARMLRRKSSSVKAVLLDQTVLAGIGNIYADEALWGAMIHPETKVQDIPKSKLKKLHEEIIYVLKLSIEKGGSTDRNYVNAEGKRGSYIDFARVFRREKLPCPRCNTTIIKTRVVARGTHTCPNCQKRSK